MKRVICKSGIEGWQGRLRRNYANFKEFTQHSFYYGLHKRLGYKTPASAWKWNPLVQGSVNPADFKRIPNPRKSSNSV